VSRAGATSRVATEACPIGGALRRSASAEEASVIGMAFSERA